MTYRFFEGKDHASVYQKYRFTPPDELKNIILQYLDKKVRGQIHYISVHSNLLKSATFTILTKITLLFRKESHMCLL